MHQEQKTSMLVLLGLVASLCLGGCATKKMSTRGNGYYGPSRAEMSDSKGRANDSGGDAPTSSVRSSAPRVAKAAPAPRRRAYTQGARPYNYIRRRRRHHVRRERRGLGTAYGERVYAPARQTTFVRASYRPQQVGRMYYNNAAGVRAMARRLRGSCRWAYPTIYTGGVRMRIVDKRERPLRGLWASGRAIVIGHHRQHYRIQLTNRTSRRVEVVVSVDGLDVIDGKRANVRKRGYILLPYHSISISGFRRSYRHVAAFRFSSINRSYSNLTGQGTRNIGVIGVAVFAERDGHRYDAQRRLGAQPFLY